MKRAALLALALGLGHAGEARAQSPKLSKYEQETLTVVLGKEKDQVDPAPQGKRIESVRIVPLDVLEDRDPYPSFFNVFHVTSRKRVIERELLFKAGERYDPLRVEESARNLRDLRQLSLVLIVPLRGSTPDSVRLVVITKDVWSLRLNSNFQAVDGKLTHLLLQPAEENLFGTHTMIGGLFVMDPASYSLGAQFINPRVAGSRIRSIASANVIFNRDSGKTEGSFGTFSYGQPLYSAETEWAWRAVVTWRDSIFRLFDVDQVALYEADDGDVPYEYELSAYYGTYLLTRSYGRRFKHDLSLGVEVDHRRANDLVPDNVDPRARAEFIDTQLPVSDTRVSPLVQLHSYTSDYLRVLDFETLGLQEDFRLGHELVVRVYPAWDQLGSSRTLLGTFAGLGYTLPLGDGLIRALASNTVELSTNAQTEALAQAKLRAVTPRLGFGRFVYDGVVVNKYRNYLNDLLVLGGDSRLRGYPPQLLVGKDVIAQNVEFRTRPVTLLATNLGAALFYDSGNAFDGFDQELTLLHSVGFGLRAAFPQANRVVFRADWGFPVSPGYNTFPGSFFLTFGQAFDVPIHQPPTHKTDFAD